MLRLARPPTRSGGEPLTNFSEQSDGPAGVGAPEPGPRNLLVRKRLPCAQTADLAPGQLMV